MEPDSTICLVDSREVSRRLADVFHAITSCERCPRLREHCRNVARVRKRAFRDEVYWGKPVPGYGDPSARLLLVGLAPAAHGANRTGRVFTGDGVGGSGDFLMSALHRTGFANIPTSQRSNDGLVLTGAWIAAAVRCAPPGNKPTPAEIAKCHPHLVAEYVALTSIRVIVCLGRIAFDAAWRLLATRNVVIRPKPAFGHGLEYRPSGGPIVIASYHPSRQNTNTGKLTAPMLTAVFESARRATSSTPNFQHPTPNGESFERSG